MKNTYQSVNTDRVENTRSVLTLIHVSADLVQESLKTDSV